MSDAPVAQRIEQLPSKQLVAGSIPAGCIFSFLNGHPSAGNVGIIFIFLLQMHRIQVAGSIPAGCIFSFLNGHPCAGNVEILFIFLL